MEYFEQPPNYRFSTLGDRLRVRVNREADTIDRDYAHAYRTASQPFFVVDRSEYTQAQGLKRALLDTYQGVGLEEAIGGEELVNEHGTCYHIETIERAHLSTISAQQAEDRLLADLKILHGIREKTEHMLKESGYRSLTDLVAHDRFGDGARRFLELIEKRDTAGILEWLGRRYSKSHQLALYASGLHTQDQLTFVDIETLGLYATPVVLLGVARLVGHAVAVHQYVLRSMHEEPAALAALLSHIDDGCALVTFNGRAFDIPYLEQRLAYYGLQGDLQRPHFDVLPLSRRVWRGISPDFKLTTLERHLIGARKADVPSALIPHFYDTYAQTQNVGPLVGIIEHNRQDLLALVHIFSKLCEGELRP